MIVSEESAKQRLNSPLNLMNKLLASKSKPKNNAMDLFIRPTAKVTEAADRQEQTETSDKSPTLDDILDNSESQLKLGLAHDTALKLLNDSVGLLATKLDDIKADKLPSVIGAASKVVESIRRERADAAKSGKDREVHYHFYTPQQKKLADYNVIDVQ